jgi:hypothetical protein
MPAPLSARSPVLWPQALRTSSKLAATRDMRVMVCLQDVKLTKEGVAVDSHEPCCASDEASNLSLYKSVGVSNRRLQVNSGGLHLINAEKVFKNTRNRPALRAL